MINGFVLPSGRELTPEELKELLEKHSYPIPPDPVAELREQLQALRKRVEVLEAANQKLGPSHSNPIPGAWPSIPAPVCAVCCGPHRTGNCAR